MCLSYVCTEILGKNFHWRTIFCLILYLSHRDTRLTNKVTLLGHWNLITRRSQTPDLIGLSIYDLYNFVLHSLEDHYFTSTTILVSDTLFPVEHQIVLPCMIWLEFLKSSYSGGLAKVWLIKRFTLSIVFPLWRPE